MVCIFKDAGDVEGNKGKEEEDEEELRKEEEEMVCSSTVHVVHNMPQKATVFAVLQIYTN